MFLESHVKVLYAAADNSELFGTMNFHWNYLDPSLLCHLVKQFDLKDVKGNLNAYESKLQQFRKKTPLTVFCRTQKRKRIILSPDFQEVVAEFEWPNEDDVTLENVEQFRQKYASHYSVHEFAMMIAEVLPCCFVVTWFVPKSIIGKLRKEENVPIEILKEYHVTKLVIAGVCVYKEEVLYNGHLIVCMSFIIEVSPSLTSYWCKSWAESALKFCAAENLIFSVVYTFSPALPQKILQTIKPQFVLYICNVFTGYWSGWVTHK